MSGWPLWAEAWPVGSAPSTRQLVERIAGVVPDDLGHFIFWASHDVDPESLTAELQRVRPRLRVWGMSSFGPCAAGAVGEAGFAGMFLPIAFVDLRGVPFVGDPAGSSADALLREVALAERALGLTRLLRPEREGFKVLFVRHGEEAEEYVAARLHLLDPDLPLVGGTAAPGPDGAPSWCVADGAVLRGTNLLLVGRSRCPLRVSHHHNYLEGKGRLVVTCIGENWRCVRRINGRPARQTLAAAFGIDPDRITPDAVAVRPLAVRIGDEWFVRSVYHVDGNDLHFASAMAPGMVLGLLEPGDQSAALSGVLTPLRTEGLRGMLSFSCLGRRLESDHLGTTSRTAAVFNDLPVVGGHTFGEQWMGLHLNQTFTTIAFLERGL